MLLLKDVWIHLPDSEKENNRVSIFLSIKYSDAPNLKLFTHTKLKQIRKYRKEQMGLVVTILLHIFPLNPL